MWWRLWWGYKVVEGGRGWWIVVVEVVEGVEEVGEGGVRGQVSRSCLQIVGV